MRVFFYAPLIPSVSTGAHTSYRVLYKVAPLCVDNCSPIPEGWKCVGPGTAIHILSLAEIGVVTSKKRVIREVHRSTTSTTHRLIINYGNAQAGIGGR